MITGDQPANAAILLFGRDPRRFFPAAEVRRMHFHGTEIQRPAPVRYEIPPDVIREAIVNAVAHRGSSRGSSRGQTYIFDKLSSFDILS